MFNLCLPASRHGAVWPQYTGLCNQETVKPYILYINTLAGAEPAFLMRKGQGGWGGVGGGGRSKIKGHHNIMNNN